MFGLERDGQKALAKIMGIGSYRTHKRRSRFHRSDCLKEHDHGPKNIDKGK